MVVENASAVESVDAFIEQIPKPEDIRTRLCETLRQAALLKLMLKLAENRRNVHEVRGRGLRHE